VVCVRARRSLLGRVPRHDGSLGHCDLWASHLSRPCLAGTAELEAAKRAAASLREGTGGKNALGQFFSSCAGFLLASGCNSRFWPRLLLSVNVT